MATPRLEGVSRKGLLLFLACGVVWGIPYLFIKIAVQDFSAPTIILARTVIGGLVLIPLAIKREGITLFHAPHYVLPPAIRCRSVVTISSRSMRLCCVEGSPTLLPPAKIS